jgi:membrane protease YdiL (CAAX protease family)/uncharacterized RDD family membrane protein YckC
MAPTAHMPAPMSSQATSPGGFAVVHSPAAAWRRGAAAGLNTIIVVVGLVVANTVVGGFANGAGIEPGSNTALVVAAIIQSLTVGGILAYCIRGWRQGATPGMRALGLSLCDRASGNLPSAEQVLLRAAGSFWGLVLLPINLALMLLSPERGGLADRSAGTAVLQNAIVSWWWVWSGTEWVPAGLPSPTGIVQPTNRRATVEATSRSRWTWTDVFPIVILQLPVAFVGQVAVIRATRAVGLGRPEPSVGSLILDAVGYGMIALLIWLFLGLRRKVSLREIGLGTLRWRWLAAAIPATVAAYAAELVAGELGAALLPSSPPTQCREIQSAYGTSVWLGLLGVAVIAPLVEETLFRGVVFGWMRGGMPLPVAVTGSALVFAAAHALYMQWTLLPPIFAIGCVLAIVYHYSRSLWPGIVIHASINTVATLALLLGAVHC